MATVSFFVKEACIYDPIHQANVLHMRLLLEGHTKTNKDNIAIRPQFLCRPFCLVDFELSISTGKKHKENQSA